MQNLPSIRTPLDHIPADLVSVTDYESLFKDFIPHDVHEYIAGGVADDITLTENRRAFDRIHLKRRVLADFSTASTHSTLLGESLRYPMMLAPVAHQKLVHPHAELATVEAANALELGFISSTLSSTSLETIASKLQTSKWFQLYFQDSRESTLSLLKRAEQAGYSAIMVTVDVPINGLRNRAQRANFSLPDNVQEINLTGYSPVPSRSLTPEQSIILNGIMQDAPTWKDIEWLQSHTQLPILLKGITHVDDAKMAQSMGLAGIVVSNHGGRSLDGSPASIDQLAAIRQSVGEDYTVLFDSGIRRGTDIFKAIALGADAVLIGRPQLYGLAIAGALGVAHIMRLLIEEFEVTMALTGCATLEQITPACIDSIHSNN